jgi:hypothetical protein
MVFSKLLDNLSNLLSSQDNKNVKKTEKINKGAINELQQGMILLKTRKNKINKLRNKLSLIENLKDFSKGEETLKKTTDNELKILNDLETKFQREIAEYTVNYKQFMELYNKGVSDVRDCKVKCTSKYSREDTNYSQKIEACKAGCDLKGPYVQECKNNFKLSRIGSLDCDGATNKRCSDGNVILGMNDIVTSSRYADSLGTTIKDGCCNCGGGSGGPPVWEKNGVKVKECGTIGKAMGYNDGSAGWAVSACNQAIVASSEKNKNLYEEYGVLTKKNENLIASAKLIFEKIQKLKKAREDIDVDMTGLDLKLDSQLTDYGTIFANIKNIRSAKNRTIDGQLEDILSKESSSSLQFIIWSGLAILTILLVLQRLRK